MDTDNDNSLPLLIVENQDDSFVGLIQAKWAGFINQIHNNWAFFMIVLIFVVTVICMTLGVLIFQGDPNLLGPIVLCDIISYYAPFIHLVFLFLLWSLTLIAFEHDNIDYTSIFDLDPDQNYLKAEDILVCTGWMILVVEPVLVLQLYLSSDVVQAAAWLPVVFYMVGAILLIIPVDCFYLSSRDYFFETINKTIHWMVHPSDALSVSQVFLTDLWVSTTKDASSDMDIDHVCYGSPYQICSSGYILVPIIQILPYILRSVQCFQQFWRTGTLINFWNGLKFISAIPVIFLPFLRNHLPDVMFIWIFLCVFNSVWMIYWDLVEDWGFRFLTEGFSFNQPALHMFGKKWVTYGVMIIDIILRFSWTYKLIHIHYQENHLYWYSSIIFIVTALEIFRRFLWTSYRMKNVSNGLDGAIVAVNAAEPEDIGDVPVV